MSNTLDTRYFPPRDPNREPFGAPIDEVTLLEDRAQVKRRARITLGEGHHRLAILDVSPIIQDVSVHADVIEGQARVTDVGVRRAIRVQRQNKPEELKALLAELEALERRWADTNEASERHSARGYKLWEMLSLSAKEIPQDAAWGFDDAEAWSQTFGALFSRHREITAHLVLLGQAASEIQRDHQNASARLALMQKPTEHFAAWIELDLVVSSSAPVELVIEYVVPNAMWRPSHSARLEGDVVTFTSQAALWQNTGEDWKDVKLMFSTARSSLGTEPPMLSDDLLRAQRKSEETVVQAREVEIQSAGVPGGSKGGPKPSTGVELPGVDDGGDVQNLRADARVNIKSDGQPNFIPLFEFKALGTLERLVVAEQADRVFLKATQRNTSGYPILAGPVELLRSGGTVGWSSILFVAAGERFELNFGPQDDMRIARSTRLVEDEVTPKDKWRHRDTRVRVFLSNLSDSKRALTVSERVPVSEIEKVVISLLEEKTTSDHDLNEDGFVTWKVELAPYERKTVELHWRLSTAPDVQGL